MSFEPSILGSIQTHIFPALSRPHEHERVAVLNVASDTLMFVPAGDDFRPVGSGLDLVAEPDALLPESV